MALKVKLISNNLSIAAKPGKQARIDFPNAVVFNGDAPTSFTPLDLSSIVRQNSA